MADIWNDAEKTERFSDRKILARDRVMTSTSGPPNVSVIWIVVPDGFANRFLNDHGLLRRPTVSRERI